MTGSVPWSDLIPLQARLMERAQGEKGGESDEEEDEEGVRKIVEVKKGARKVTLGHHWLEAEHMCSSTEYPVSRVYFWLRSSSLPMAGFGCICLVAPRLLNSDFYNYELF